MSIVGIGNDIVKVSRIETLVKRYDQRFLKRVFTAKETQYAFDKARPALHLAARFAAKEAFLKALGSGLRKGLNWCDIEVVNNQFGQPRLQLYNYAKQECHEKRNAGTWLSLAHEQEFAIAFVVLEERRKFS